MEPLKNIRDLRKKLHISQVEAAKALGVSRPTYAKIELGIQDMTMQRMVRLYEYFSGYKPTSELLYDALQWVQQVMKEEGFPKNELHLKTIRNWCKEYEATLPHVKGTNVPIPPLGSHKE